MEINDLSRKDKTDNDAKDSCSNLKKSIPLLNELFHIHCKVGEGTFSSVFLATMKSSNRHKKFALKHLIPTCHPERIERELQCLQQMGGKDHIVSIDLCLRNQGSVVFVMPYMKHDKFSEYVKDMTVEETKDYMRALLSAVRRVHQFNIIHRDVKPSNFLYNRANRKYLLVDFGLAQQCTEYNAKDFKTIKTNVETTEIQSMKRKRSDSDEFNSNVTKKDADNKCNCFGKPKVCALCLTRPQQTAPRAGTPGFRAPEVLLKHPSQTPAIDIWACGVMMLCILSGTQVFFRSPDDCTALAEITTIFGSRKVQQCAEKLGKKIIFSENLPGIDIMSLCLKLRKRNRSMMHNRENSTCKVSPNIEYPKEAYQLLIKLLNLDYETRITAEQALSHPFLNL